MALPSPGTFFLPSNAETLLLQACLLEGDRAGAAFAAWSANPQQALEELQETGSKRRLLPLLQASLERSKIAVPPELQATLRAAALYEKLRTSAYRDIAANVFRNLGEAEIPFLATRGVCFSATIYPDSLRHCHDIDLLVHPSNVESLVRVLTEHSDFKPDDSAASAASDRLLVHSSGLPFAIHTRAVKSEPDELPWELLEQNQAALFIYESQVRTLSPEVTLLHLLLHTVSTASRRSLIWLCDAFQLIKQGTIDWKLFTGHVSDPYHLAIAIPALSYLSTHLHASVPEALQLELEARWSKLSEADRRKATGRALTVISQSGVIGRKAMLRQTGGVIPKAQLLRLFLSSSTQRNAPP
jgi:hypothetical protein